jgi:hypothetical protein
VKSGGTMCRALDASALHIPGAGGVQLRVDAPVARATASGPWPAWSRGPADETGRAPKNKQTNNHLFLGLLQAFGHERASYGDPKYGTTPLADILA